MADERGTAREKIGLRGLPMDVEDTLDRCVELFEDSWFTVSMYCLGYKGAKADDCVEHLIALHHCGCVRKPVNDGGQEYYQVMPGIVYPRKSVGARA